MSTNKDCCSSWSNGQRESVFIINFGRLINKDDFETAHRIEYSDLKSKN